MVATKELIFKGLAASALVVTSCNTNKKELPKPNIILIMADDMGYECISSNGSLSYSTPVIDSLAEQGIRFTQSISQPLSTPSRVKIMTGLYNYRNYEYFGYLNPNQKTFGNVMKEGGYSTLIAGKWQLNGLAYDLEGFKDNTRPNHFGFDEYCLWQLTEKKAKGERYSNPFIEQNGEVLDTNEDNYGPDIFADYIIDFIKRKEANPFFIYYPMVLVHNPFVPTPDSDEWTEKNQRYKGNKEYFKDMVEYTDKIVGEIANTLKERGLDNNTILIFTADNGTNRSITSNTINGQVHGFKGNTTDAGTHVPMIAYWPNGIKKGKVYNGLIDFNDFFPTLAEIAEIPVKSDGKSFYNLLKGKKFKDKESIIVHYDPMWGKNVNKYRNRFSMTTNYKLYQDGKFYNLQKDLLELDSLPNDQLNETELILKNDLQGELDKAPPWK